MKRSPALVPLSQEHHEALALARRAAGAGLHDPDGALAQREHLLQRWPAQFALHFDAEERALLPLLRAAGHAQWADQALAHHTALRELFARLRDGDLAALRPWGEAMQAHVRFEERELFPLAERVLDPTRLAEAMARSGHLPLSST